MIVGTTSSYRLPSVKERGEVRKLAAFVAACAMVGGATAPAMAQESRPPGGPTTTTFNATIKGYPTNTPLVELPPSMVLDIDVLNLPGAVGVYALHCEVPANPRSAPTNCDSAIGAQQYFPATGQDRQSFAIPLRVNAEFYGTNPNPTDGAPNTPTFVDCRKPADRGTTCGIYVLGAGREAANPAYLRFWPTAFSALTKERRAQQATVTVDGKPYASGATLVKDRATPFRVRLSSGLTPNLSSDNCQVTDSTITALIGDGQCTVTITSSGGRNVRPFIQTLTFALS
jgi:hypothetical protein